MRIRHIILAASITKALMATPWSMPPLPEVSWAWIDGPITVLHRGVYLADTTWWRHDHDEAEI